MTFFNQFNGYLNTPQLWFSNSVYDLEQIELPKAKFEVIDLPKLSIRLGKRVEQFIYFELAQNNSIDILSENLQIINDKTTIGELDCILKQNDELIHLEIVYKFYLYDPIISGSDLEKWIGPNRRDSLVQKLNKLKEKQFPLLFRSETEEYLSDLNLKANDIHQKVCFKAQLFVPLNILNSTFKLINNDCIVGFYIRFEELEFLKLNSFYIPAKLDWLCEAHLNVNWEKFLDFKNKISTYMMDKKSPLCWTINAEGKLSTFFIVWWD